MYLSFKLSPERLPGSSIRLRVKTALEVNNYQVLRPFVLRPELASLWDIYAKVPKETSAGYQRRAAEGHDLTRALVLGVGQLDADAMVGAVEVELGKLESIHRKALYRFRIKSDLAVPADAYNFCCASRPLTLVFCKWHYRPPLLQFTINLMLTRAVIKIKLYFILSFNKN